MRTALAMGGNRIVNVADGVNPTDAATVGQLTTGGGVPLGAVIDYWGATPPEGFLFPYGQAVSRSTYADLFALIGTVAGSGDGSTTFNLPDYRGRVGAGKDNMGGTTASRLTAAGSGVTGTTLGAAGGEQTHTLTTTEMPSHTHTLTDPGHTHTAAETGGPGASGGGVAGAEAAPTGSSTTGITIASTGGGAAHNNVQPTIVVNKIIRVL